MTLTSDLYGSLLLDNNVIFVLRYDILNLDGISVNSKLHICRETIFETRKSQYFVFLSGLPDPFRLLLNNDTKNSLSSIGDKSYKKSSYLY